MLMDTQNLYFGKWRLESEGIGLSESYPPPPPPPNEMVQQSGPYIWQGKTENVNKIHIVFVLSFIIIGVCLLFSSVFLIDNPGGMVVMLVFGFLVFFGGIYYAYKTRFGDISYGLTNSKAVVLSRGQVVQECELVNCTVSVMNKYSAMSGAVSGGQYGGSYSGSSSVMGDVLFREGTGGMLVFKRVRDPDGIMYTANQLISELSRAQNPQPPPTQMITKETIIRERVKVRCPYCKTLYDEELGKCPQCGASA
jgi:hypothetical protein